MEIVNLSLVILFPFFNFPCTCYFLPVPCFKNILELEYFIFWSSEGFELQ